MPRHPVSIFLIKIRTRESARKKAREAQQKLLEAVVAAKHELSEATNTSIDIPNFIQDESGQPHHIDNFEITREQINEEIRDLILQTKDSVEKALSTAKLDD